MEEGESIDFAAKREAEEEIGVRVQSLLKVAELKFLFPAKPEWDQLVHVYLADRWDGDPRESEEMSPRWFATHGIPYAEMWSDDVLWLPRVLSGDSVAGTFSFGENDEVLSCAIS